MFLLPVGATCVRIDHATDVLVLILFQCITTRC